MRKSEINNKIQKTKHDKIMRGNQHENHALLIGSKIGLLSSNMRVMT